MRVNNAQKRHHKRHRKRDPLIKSINKLECLKPERDIKFARIRSGIATLIILDNIVAALSLLFWD
jgi:hypothetical protein